MSNNATPSPASKKNLPAQVRILLIGPPKSGKTAIRRSILHQEFTTVYKKSFLSKHDTYMHIENTSIPVELWDGTEDAWPAIVQLIVDVVLICLDIEDPQSLKKVQSSKYFAALFKRRWDVPIVFVGCKDDLRQTENPKNLLVESHVQDWTEMNELTYTECSAKNGDVLTVLKIVGMIVTANERREHYKTPQAMYSTQVGLVKGLRKLSIAKGFRQVFSAYSDRLALGERMYDGEGNRMLKYDWTTYETLGKRVKNFGCGLKSLIQTRSFVCVCAENSVSWIVADLSLQIQNMISVMLHYTLPDEDIDYVVEHSKLDAVVTTPSLAPSFARAAAASPNLKVVVIQTPKYPIEPKKRDQKSSNIIDAEKRDEDIGKVIEKCKQIAPNTKFLLQSEVEKIGEDLPDTYEEATDPNCLFSISYTSGSTGRPKGIMMSEKSHRVDVLHDSISPSVGVVFEPLSHSERVNTYAKLCGGGRVAFFNGDVADLLEEFQVAKPTLFVSVPRFWNVLYGEFNQIVSLYRKFLPDKGPARAQRMARKLFESLMGGRITYAATGGAPTSQAVLNWMHGFDFIVSESYGSMEVGGITSSKRFSPDLEFKIVDVPEMGYLSTDKPYPRGELCIKSTTMFSGYHNNDEETKDAFIEGGFFRTGDIVQLEGPETVKIIDRRKFIFKLAQGEYVSPAKSEGVYEKSKFISQIMAYGNSFQTYLVALVVPNASILQAWSQAHGINATFEELCRVPDIKRLILNDMRSCEVVAQLRPYEIVRDIAISPILFTPENGLLTATSKLNRRGILNKHKHALEALYDRASDPENKLTLSGNLRISGIIDEAQSKEQQALNVLKDLVRKALPRDASSSSSNVDSGLQLIDSGLDSMSALKLVKTIQETTQVSVPISSLYQPGMTVQSLAQIVTQQQGTLEHLRTTDNSMFEQEDSPDSDIDPYNWMPELLPKYKSLNEKRLEEEAKLAKQKELKTNMEKELLGSILSGAKKLKHVDSGDGNGNNSESNHNSNNNSNNNDNSSSSSNSKNKDKKPFLNLFERIHCKNILLTGASGFLGLYLLKEILIVYPESKVICLIRASNDESANEKLRKALQFGNVGISDDDLSKRVEVWNADLAKPNQFGLSAERWEWLRENLDSIFQCASWVNGLFPYQVLRNANVVSTVQLLKLALTGSHNNRKAFHYISTLSAISRTSGWTPEFSISTSAKLIGFDGYPLTKRVCEMLIANIEDLVPNLPIAIYRPGSIFAHTSTGHFNIEAYIHKLICGIIQLGHYPRTKKFQIQFDWTPVDYAAQAIVNISKDGGNMRAPKRYNICNPWSIYSMGMERLVRYISEFGYKLTSLPYHAWRKALFDSFEQNPGFNKLEPLKSYFDDSFPNDTKYECSSTINSLKPLKKVDKEGKPLPGLPAIDHTGKPAAKCYPITKDTIHAVLRFAIQKGYISGPPATQ